MIPAEQVMLLWLGISGLTGTIISLLISEGKNPLYILANVFTCGFVGILASGFFMEWTDALVWDFWSLLIPIFLGGITSFIIAIYLRDRIPEPEFKVRTIAFALAIVMIIVISFGSAYPFISKPNYVPNVDDTQPRIFIDLSGENMLVPQGFENMVNLNPSPDFIKLSVSDVLNSPIKDSPIKLDIKGYTSYIDFPRVMATDPVEGQTLAFRFSLTVSTTSPVNWSKPQIFILVWGDKNKNGRYDEGIDFDMPDIYWRMSALAGNYTRVPCFYNISNGEPMFASTTAIPIIFGNMMFGRDDSLYTFHNTPKGWKPPYNQASHYLRYNATADAYDIIPWESVESYRPLEIGHNANLAGELYCGPGMANITDKWYITLIAFDANYSYTEEIARYNLSFNVLSNKQKPIVDVTGEWWVLAVFFGLFAVVTVAVIRIGKWALR